MIALTDLLAKIDERRIRLDQVDQAIADIRTLCPPTKRKRSGRQLRLPFAERTKKPRRQAAKLRFA